MRLATLYLLVCALAFCAGYFGRKACLEAQAAPAPAATGLRILT